MTTRKQAIAGVRSYSNHKWAWDVDDAGMVYVTGSEPGIALHRARDDGYNGPVFYVPHQGKPIPLFGQRGKKQ